MLSLNVGSNINQVAGWLTNVQRKQLPFATAGALTDTAFDVRKHVVERTFPRDFDLKNKRFAGATLRVDKANKRKLRAAVYDRLGREYLETQARGGSWYYVPWVVRSADRHRYGIAFRNYNNGFRISRTLP